jgi:alpha-galactosidase
MRVALLVIACLVGGVHTVLPAEPAPVVTVGSAFISHDPAAGTWIIGSAGAELTLGLDPGRDFAVVRFASPGDRSWTTAAAPDTVVRVGGQTVPFGNRAAGFTYQNVATSVRGLTAQLDATFDLAKSRVRVTRHYAATSGSPTFEVWTTFTSLGGVVTLTDLEAFHLTVPAGTMRWVNGLRGDNPAVQDDSAFTMEQRDLAVGERVALGAQGRASEETVPWFAVDGPGEEFYAGLMWSGAWSLAAVRSGAGLDLTLGLAAMSTSVPATVEGPHAFFGVVQGGTAQASAALRTYLIQGVRGGRPLSPLVTYNTWFAYGVGVDEASMRREIDGAADLGAELFVLDAGWYVGAGRSGVSDFSSGLGTWRVDSSRFPNGLRSLSDYAHGRGLKFGIWVEPESVAQSTVNQPGLAQEGWLAKENGKYGSTVTAQICLGSAAARQWVLSQVEQLIDEVRPDYLKWDNNMWINCNRSGHVHGETDGNFFQVNGLYEILGDLRARYPDLLIENVSGGGNRLDVGMLRYSDVAWMDDRSAPSAVVRHNIEGLSAVFPPAYLLSFVMDSVEEPLHGAPDFRMYFRSRMIGTLGLCYGTGDFDESDQAEMRSQISLFKYLRDTLGDGSHAVLTSQALHRQGPAWDVLQTAGSDSRPVVLWAFQSDHAVAEFTARPVGLSAPTRYVVESADVGWIGVATGADLMANGIQLLQSPISDAHVLMLKPLSR